mgnify:CR=1 FL=1
MFSKTMDVKSLNSIRYEKTPLDRAFFTCLIINDLKLTLKSQRMGHFLVFYEMYYLFFNHSSLSNELAQFFENS